MNTTSSLKINDWLKHATIRLSQAGIATARLDCLVLLEDITSIDRAKLLAEPKKIIRASLLKRLDKQIAERTLHVPLAYIRGKTEFYGREFMINHSVLEPRPESETMIDMLKQLKSTNEAIIVDIGTGSGALAITAKLEIPKAQVIATDIDPNCLKISKKNAKNLGVTIDFRLGNLIDPIINLVDQYLILLCNLPYVPNSFQINPAALQEPRQAIFGGQDGLDVYRKIFKQLQTVRKSPILVLTESMPPQHSELTNIANNSGFELQKSDDFIQQFWHN